MARVARHMALMIGEGSVDVADDSEHIPRHALLRVVIAGEIAGDMAVSALDAKRSSKCAHHLLNVGVGGKNPEVFGRPRRRGSWRVTSSAPLSCQRERTENQQGKDCAHGAHPIPPGPMCQMNGVVLFKIQSCLGSAELNLVDEVLAVNVFGLNDGLAVLLFGILNGRCGSKALAGV